MIRLKYYYNLIMFLKCLLKGYKNYYKTLGDYINRYKMNNVDAFLFFIVKFIMVMLWTEKNECIRENNKKEYEKRLKSLSQDMIYFMIKYFDIGSAIKKS